MLQWTRWNRPRSQLLFFTLSLNIICWHYLLALSAHYLLHNKTNEQSACNEFILICDKRFLLQNQLFEQTVKFSNSSTSTICSLNWHSKLANSNISSVQKSYGLSQTTFVCTQTILLIDASFKLVKWKLTANSFGLQLSSSKLEQLQILAVTKFVRKWM